MLRDKGASHGPQHEDLHVYFALMAASCRNGPVETCPLDHLDSAWVAHSGLQQPTLITGELPNASSSHLPVEIDLQQIAKVIGEDVEVQTLDIKQQAPGPKWTLRQWCLYWKDRKSVVMHGDVAGIATRKKGEIKGGSPSVSLHEREEQHGAQGSAAAAAMGSGTSAELSEMEDEADSAFVHQGAVDQFLESSAPRKGIRESSKGRFLALSCLCIDSTELATADLSPPPALGAINMLSSESWGAGGSGWKEVARQHSSRHYLSVAPAGAASNFRLNAGGATSWFLVKQGSMNLQVYCAWIRCGARDAGLPLLDECPGVIRIEVEAGQAVIIPGGWPYAWAAQCETLLIGSQFLHIYNMGLQFVCSEMEELLCLKGSQRFPSYHHVMWQAAIHYAKIIRSVTGLPKLSLQRPGAVEGGTLKAITASRNRGARRYDKGPEVKSKPKGRDKDHVQHLGGARAVPAAAASDGVLAPETRKRGRARRESSDDACGSKGRHGVFDAGIMPPPASRPRVSNESRGHYHGSLLESLMACSEPPGQALNAVPDSFPQEPSAGVLDASFLAALEDSCQAAEGNPAWSERLSLGGLGEHEQTHDDLAPFCDTTVRALTAASDHLIERHVGDQVGGDEEEDSKMHSSVCATSATLASVSSSGCNGKSAPEVDPMTRTDAQQGGHATPETIELPSTSASLHHQCAAGLALGPNPQVLSETEPSLPGQAALHRPTKIKLRTSQTSKFTQTAALRPVGITAGGESNSAVIPQTDGPDDSMSDGGIIIPQTEGPDDDLGRSSAHVHIDAGSHPGTDVGTSAPVMAVHQDETRGRRPAHGCADGAQIGEAVAAHVDPAHSSGLFASANQDVNTCQQAPNSLRDMACPEFHMEDVVAEPSEKNPLQDTSLNLGMPPPSPKRSLVNQSPTEQPCPEAEVQVPTTARDACGPSPTGHGDPTGQLGNHSPQENMDGADVLRPSATRLPCEEETSASHAAGAGQILASSEHAAPEKHRSVELQTGGHAVPASMLSTGAISTPGPFKAGHSHHWHQHPGLHQSKTRHGHHKADSAPDAASVELIALGTRKRQNQQNQLPPRGATTTPSGARRPPSGLPPSCRSDPPPAHEEGNHPAGDAEDAMPLVNERLVCAEDSAALGSIQGLIQQVDQADLQALVKDGVVSKEEDADPAVRGALIQEPAAAPAAGPSCWEIAGLIVLISILRQSLEEASYRVMDEIPYALRDPAFLLDQLEEAVLKFHEEEPFADQGIVALTTTPLLSAVSAEVGESFNSIDAGHTMVRCLSTIRILPSELLPPSWQTCDGSDGQLGNDVMRGYSPEPGSGIGAMLPSTMLPSHDEVDNGGDVEETGESNPLESLPQSSLKTVPGRQPHRPQPESVPGRVASGSHAANNLDRLHAQGLGDMSDAARGAMRGAVGSLDGNRNLGRDRGVRAGVKAAASSKKVAKMRRNLGI